MSRNRLRLRGVVRGFSEGEEEDRRAVREAVQYLGEGLRRVAAIEKSCDGR